jgi:hypothetical protein
LAGSNGFKATLAPPAAKSIAPVTIGPLLPKMTLAAAASPAFALASRLFVIPYALLCIILVV